MNESITLNELTRLIRSAIVGSLPDSIWVVAEVSELNLNKSGHCYLELAEKDMYGNRIIARMRAMIWANVFRNIKPYFEKTTGYPLAAGIKLMVLAQVEFHEVYGLSLNIKDIDPSYTLGDIARRKQETINRLKEEGVFDMNRSIDIPLVTQRIAIISSETAAGFGDFMDSLNTNRFGIRFTAKLFPALMQGEKSEASVINAFDEVFKLEGHFDIVVLIRGGGAQSELDCFNSYDLAFYITQFPLPVITGIGHERDETVADMVANVSLKTPTAVADFIITRTGGFLEKIMLSSEKLFLLSTSLINNYREELRFTSIGISRSTKELLVFGSNSLDRLHTSISKTVFHFSELKFFELTKINEDIIRNISYRITNEKTRLNGVHSDIQRAVSGFLGMQAIAVSNAEKNLEYLNPVKILKRGFTITYKNGKIIKGVTNIKKGEIIDTLFSDGKIKSRVEGTEETINES